MSASPRSPARQALMMVTGISGAGKSTALRVLDDLGWETIDNFPVRLLPGIVNGGDVNGGDRARLAIGFDSRTRGFSPDAVIDLCRSLEERDVEISTVFLDAGTG